MEKQSAQIATIGECIDHCFAFSMWCKDFARHIDPEDMVAGLDRAFEIVSDATRLQSFLALRKLDEFFRLAKSKADDLIASDLGVDVNAVLGGNEGSFLSTSERENLNKGVAHLTEKLSLDPDSEVDLFDILKRSMPVFERLVAALRKVDAQNEAVGRLDKTVALMDYAQKQDEAAVDVNVAAEQ